MKQEEAPSTPVQRQSRHIKTSNCSVCNKPGHRARFFPEKQNKPTNKKIRLANDHPRCVRCMNDNELFGKLGAVNLVVTLDSGANTSLVPEELVDSVCFTGNTTRVRTAIRYKWENMEDK